MNTRDIIAIRKVCELKSVSKAAGELFITPQALSQTVRKIENEFGITLFHRQSGGMVMTRYGKIFYEKSQKLLDDLEEMDNLFRLEAGNENGEIRVAVALGVTAEIMPETLWNFNRRYPNFQVSMIEGTDKKVETLVRDKSVDLGIAIEPVNREEFLVVPWCSLEQCALFHKDSRLSKRLGDSDRLSILDLKDEPLTLENKDFKVFGKLIRMCEHWGFTPNIYFETTEISLAHALADANKAVALTPRYAVDMAAHRNLRIASFEEEYSWQWCFIKRRDQELSEMENCFVNYLIEKTGYEGKMY